jgi:hypothetical protein
MPAFLLDFYTCFLCPHRHPANASIQRLKATLNKPTMMSTPVAKIAVAVSWHDKCRADACFWLP